MTYPTKTIYLAGPISGQSYEEARFGWRKTYAELVHNRPYDHMKCVSPMRADEFLADIDKIEGSYPELHPMATSAGIVTRDHNDVYNCDLMVACFIEDGGRASLGTAVEFGWAMAYNKPIIMIAGEDNEHRVHPMLKRMAGFIVETLEEAAYLSVKLLTPGI